VVAVYEGVLETMSQGEVLSSGGTGGYATDRGVNIARFHTTGVDPQHGWIQRQFVDIGGTRLKNVVVKPYQDALLEEAVGQHVALSVLGPPADSGGRHVVVAIRTPRAGVDRPSRKVLLGSSSWLVVKHWVTAPFFFLILLLGSWLMSQVYAPLLELGAWIAFGVMVWWMVVPFFRISKVVKTATALDEPNGVSLAPGS
jgi:hypothetical protein